VSVVGLAWDRVNFFHSSDIVLCFGFVVKAALKTPMFWLLLSSACAGSRLSLFPTLPTLPSW